MAAVATDKIRIDGGTQIRVELNEATVTEYHDLMSEGVKLPPIVVFFDGTIYWLADGFHRYMAATRLKKLRLECDVRKGSMRDALLFAVGANQSHGLKRSNADKRKAVQTLLDDEEWAKWSDRKLADACGVSNQFVANLRPQLSTVDSSTPAEPEKRVGIDGKARTVKPKAKAEDSVTEVAAEAEPDEDAWLDELREPYKEAVSAIQKIRRDLGKLAEEEKSGAHLAEPWGRIRTALDESKQAISQATPHAECPYCKRKGCGQCKKTGFVTKFGWNSLPTEMRA